MGQILTASANFASAFSGCFCSRRSLPSRESFREAVSAAGTGRADRANGTPLAGRRKAIRSMIQRNSAHSSHSENPRERNKSASLPPRRFSFFRRFPYRPPPATITLCRPLSTTWALLSSIRRIGNWTRKRSARAKGGHRLQPRRRLLDGGRAYGIGRPGPNGPGRLGRHAQGI